MTLSDIAGRRRELAGALFGALAFLTVGAAHAAPSRVVSMNVCTDQMAMLIAAEGQLLSVSYLAAEPGSSALAAQAESYAVNHGLAEEIFLLRPDLVLAGTYTTRTTVAMLRRLGFQVEEFAPESSFDDVRTNMLRMGELLGREDKARGLVTELDTALAEGAPKQPSGMTVATYSANSYTSGSGSLADAVIAAAGLENLGTQLGIHGAGRLPLETLILLMPDMVVVDGREYSSPALARQNFEHPAFAAVATDERRVGIASSLWICGGPFTLEAIRILENKSRQQGAGR